MKLFYIIALLLVAAMVASPFYLLKTDVVGGSLIRAYDKDGRPVIEHDPVVVHSMYGSAIKTVDPAVCGDVSSGALLGQAFEGLLSYKYLELDGTVPIVQPCLAEALPTVSEDGRVYTFKLKKGVKYHRNPCFGKLHDVEVDGKPYTVYNTHEMTAEDVILAFKRQADPYVNCTLVWPFLRQRIVGLDDWRTKVRMQYDKGDFKRYDESIKGLRAIDKYTLEITLHERFPQFVYLFAISNLAPIPREAVDYWLAGERGNPAGVTPIYDRNPEFTKAEQLVGTGPYLVEKFWPKYRYVLTRNPDFRFDPYPTKGDEQFVKAGFLDPDYTGKAMPFIDRAVFTFTAQNLPAWQLFLQGERDVSAIPREMFKKIVTPSKSLTDSWAKDGIRLIKAWDPSNAVLYFNMQDPVIGGSRSLRH
ncbi:MAG: hypothetical protein HN909_05155, partial [Phycisphaerales bacterium]|nr:hypothetical protein [Phycisphaerales bacterium]